MGQTLAEANDDQVALSLRDVCLALDGGAIDDARALLVEKAPFIRPETISRRYTPLQSIRTFVADHFIDRYSNTPLIFPGTLRLLSKLFPIELPYHRNWKTNECHQLYWTLFPTIDHVEPVTRNGADLPENWVTTSMVHNAAKANFTLTELGWTLQPRDQFSTWDGLMSWYVSFVEANPEHLAGDNYLRTWLGAAKSTGA